jgi:1,4-alpha-glucan branching enzyme
LPECAYRPAGPFVDALGEAHEARAGLESVLAAHGMARCFVESHMIRGGVLAWSLGSQFRERRLDRPRPVAPEEADASLYRPHWIGDGTVPFTVLARDPRTGVQVWSGECGYPGAGVYLEFHKRHYPGGHRYWAVTDPQADLADKVPYRPELVEAKVAEQSAHFVKLLEEIVTTYDGESPPLICAPYDAELFGHWWFEGPRWLEATLAEIDRSSIVRATTPSEYCARHPPDDRMLLPSGSWGDNGDHRTWHGPHTRHFWERNYQGEAALRRVLEAPPEDAIGRRYLEQAARSLLLLQASDWPFLIYSKTGEDYAASRIDGHAEDLEFLLAALDRRDRAPESEQAADREGLARLEERDAVFPEIEPEQLLR